MKITSQELTYCFDKTAEITEQYKLMHIGSDDPLKYVNNFISTCETYLNVKIRKIRRNRRTNCRKAAVLGAWFERGNGEFDIFFNDDLNECWERFVVCKEVFHVVLAKDAYRNMSICDHIEDLLVEVPDGHEPELSNVAEKLAQFAATEFLLPYQSRQELIRKENGQINYQKIAERFKVPLVFVESYMSDQLMRFLQPYCTARLVRIKAAPAC